MNYTTHRLYLTIIFLPRHLQIDIKRFDELFIVEAIGTLLDRHLGGLPLGIAVLEVEHLVALLDDMVGHALLAQILLAVFKIVAQRLLGQGGLAVAVGIELVEHEDTGLLQVEYLARLGPDGLTDELPNSSLVLHSMF